ncbi:hypothetical protein ACFPXP_10850 [Marinicrinis lubricantis]|uniref:Transposase InsH N-terminal domain-containing protein n=1 Tax=Marinicrinis lubricantis TaxID=2086470 RepID=A0ABW1IPA4_9BACL
MKQMPEKMNLHGSLHIAGMKGTEEDEVLAKIRYDRQYILGVTLSDQMIR